MKYFLLLLFIMKIAFLTLFIYISYYISMYFQFYWMYFSKATIFYQFRSQGNPCLSFTVRNKINLVLAS